MSFREKSAWVTVTSILLVSGFYYTARIVFYRRGV